MSLKYSDLRKKFRMEQTTRFWKVENVQRCFPGRGFVYLLIVMQNVLTFGKKKAQVCKKYISNNTFHLKKINSVVNRVKIKYKNGGC